MQNMLEIFDHIFLLKHKLGKSKKKKKRYKKSFDIFKNWVTA